MVTKYYAGRFVLMFVGVAAALILLCGSEPVHAASFLNSCTTNCHGMPPRDAARKGNPHFGSMSSTVTGNHKNHLSAAPIAGDCSTCHTPVGSANFGHQNDVINMASTIKGGSYAKGVFINQTSIPFLTNATCSNTSCHFEAITPAWGSVTTTSCSACHGAPPAGNIGTPAGGLAGSHARHDAYFPGTSNCQKCHPGTTGFSHATSAGRALKVQGFLRDPANILEPSGGYSGAGLNYLPSQSGSQTFGQCSNLYCHSSAQGTSGTGAATYQTPTWGGAALGCGSCHQNMGPAVNAAATGKHAKHAQAAAISCTVCHGASYTSTTVPTGTGTTHVDKNINLAWTGLAATPPTAYSKTNTFAAGSAAYGTCSTSYCHSTVQNTADGTNAVVTYHTVAWNPATASLTCSGCHVDMATDVTGSGGHKIHTLSSGANLDCARCHLGYTKSTSAAATHINGSIELGAAGVTYSQGSGAGHPSGNGYGTCSVTVCHGSGIVTWGSTLWSTTDQCAKCHSSSAAGAVTASTPFYSTAFPTKNIDSTNAKTGAHTAHITSSESLTPGLACTNCHGTVSLNDDTHMNGVTNFTFGTLAKTGNLNPSYDSVSGVCSNVYCHGAAMPGGDAGGSNRTPRWNDSTYLPSAITVDAGCKTCHGFPPSTAAGHPVVTIPVGFPATATIGTTCNCHGNINTAGNSYATMFVDKTKHINGILEGGKCDSCHGYPPVSAGFVGAQNNWSSARVENYPGGGGAHTVNNHVSKTATANDGFAFCVKCHSSGDHMTGATSYLPKVTVNNRYRFEAAKQFKYTSNRLDGVNHVTGVCSNSSCHFGASPKWDSSH